jgi:hypothetical protein
MKVVHEAGEGDLQKTLEKKSKMSRAHVLYI